MAEMYSYMSERSSDKSGKHDSTRSILRNKKNCVTYERINKQSDERTNGRKISPFYRTSSPTGAAAQKAAFCTRSHLVLTVKLTSILRCVNERRNISDKTLKSRLLHLISPCFNLKKPVAAPDLTLF